MSDPKSFYNLGNTTTGFGQQETLPDGTTITHHGLDFPEQFGAQIPSLSPGKVVATGYDTQLGNYVTIQYQGSKFTYGHMSQIGVSNGASVDYGTTLGLVGSTGESTGPHVHVAIQNPNGDYIDPNPIIAFIEKNGSLIFGGSGNPISGIIDAAKSLVGGVSDAANTASNVANAAGSIAKDIGDLAGWLLNAKHWWAIGFTLAGVALVFIGVNLYTYEYQEKTMETVAKVAEVA